MFQSTITPLGLVSTAGYFHLWLDDIASHHSMINEIAVPSSKRAAGRTFCAIRNRILWIMILWEILRTLYSETAHTSELKHIKWTICDHVKIILQKLQPHTVHVKRKTNNWKEMNHVGESHVKISESRGEESCENKWIVVESHENQWIVEESHEKSMNSWIISCGNRWIMWNNHMWKSLNRVEESHMKKWIRCENKWTISKNQI